MQANPQNIALLSSLCVDSTTCTTAAIEQLNESCFCVSLDEHAVQAALETDLTEPGLAALMRDRCPYVFAANPVFISGAHVRQMREIVQAVEAVVALPAYRESILAQAPAIARHPPHGAKGVFYGYDFHVSGDGVALIEVNTNAGGAMLNAVVARAHRACCAAVERMLPASDADTLEMNIVDMFRREWQASGNPRPLHTIAIVDEAPESQYLYPEFLLFQQLFSRHGMNALIAAPQDLTFRDGTLWHGATRIDLVYNRLTDFMLQAPDSAALRCAYLADAAVVTPHPQGHSLYANKRNLALFTDHRRLEELGVPAAAQAALIKGIPRTEIVDPSHAERLWSERRQLFFKPAAGYGSRAAYRGDKLTRRVWEEILASDYIAQALAMPSERATGPEAASRRMKFDVRAYVYNGEIQWLAARLYQGQTTNFRTPGGGFAPVYSLGD